MRDGSNLPSGLDHEIGKLHQAMRTMICPEQQTRIARVVKDYVAKHVDEMILLCVDTHVKRACSCALFWQPTSNDILATRRRRL
jgi:hypothetical protein